MADGPSTSAMDVTAMPSGAGRWKDGKIVSLRVENFLTYSNCSVSPDPDLNVIIGPNGTGKSSIVCAICLVLNGKPGLLGRARDEREFIRYGCDKATVEIELHRDNLPNRTIKRVISHGLPKNRWFVDGTGCAIEDVNAVIKEMRIQIGNLCQFLPQDRVQAFSSMNDIDRLKDSMNSIDPKLSEKHSELMSLINEGHSLDDSKRKVDELIRNVTSQIDQLQPDIDRFNERIACEEKVTLLTRKKAFLIHDMQLTAYEELLAHKREATKKVSDSKQSLKPIENSINAAKAKITQIHADDNLLKHEVVAIVRKQENQLNNLKKLKEKDDVFSGEFRDKQRQEKKRQEDVKTLKGEITEYQAELDTLKSPEVIKEKIAEMSQKLNDLDIEQMSKSSILVKLKEAKDNLERENAKLLREKGALANIFEKRKTLLRDENPDAYAAYDWYLSHMELFNSEVVPPMILSLNVADQSLVKQVETLIDKRDLFAFIFTSREDLSRFVDEVNINMGNRTASLLAPTEEEVAKFIPPDDQLMKQLGLRCVIYDILKGPDPAIRYLLENNGIHRVPIGTTELENRVEQVAVHFPRFFSPDRHFLCKKSRYSGNVQTIEEKLVPAQLLADSLDEEKLKEIEEKLASQKAELEKVKLEHQQVEMESTRLDMAVDALRRQRTQLMLERQRREKLIHKIELKQQTLQQRQATSVDLKAAYRKLVELSQKNHTEKVKVLSSIHSQLSCAISTNEKHAINVSQIGFHQFHMKTHQDHLAAKTARNSSQEQALQQLVTEIGEKKQLVRQLWLDALRECQLDNSVRSIPQAIQDSFSSNNIPESLPEVEAALDDESSRLSQLSPIDRSKQVRYSELKLTLADLHDKKDQGEESIHSHLTLVAKLREEWLNRLNALISNIDRNFSRFMSEMKCAGSVSLCYPDELAYEKYGLSIKVSYRSGEEAAELRREYQSGGEKSVATMLYLLSLQELNTVPFRIVDEINQGMDSANERKVFDMIVETVSSTCSSQYFFVTPKLLLDLNYKPNMRILTVINGPENLISSDQWKIPRFIRRHRKLEELEQTAMQEETVVS